MVHLCVSILTEPNGSKTRVFQIQKPSGREIGGPCGVRQKRDASSSSPALAPLTDSSTGNMNSQILSSGSYSRHWPLKLSGDEREAFSSLGHCTQKLVVFCRPAFTAKTTHCHVVASRATEAGPRFRNFKRPSSPFLSTAAG